MEKKDHPCIGSLSNLLEVLENWSGEDVAVVEVHLKKLFDEKMDKQMRNHFQNKERVHQMDGQEVDVQGQLQWYMD